ncbi:MAG TPA: peptide-binding protein [Campylobacterales bacterium]|nr:peptide-binding protein [Campylobacterales bacterium]
MNQQGYQVNTIQLLGLMVLAYAFSFGIRLIWVFQFQDNPAFMWNNELMINTNDGYFFAAGAQQALEGLHLDNPRVFGLWDYGVIAITTLLAKITGLSLDTIILYMPALISSLVVVPIILIGHLYKEPLWGFFAALLGSITWSYYNRTMVGYYDTDMFSAMAPMIILFFLIKSTLDLRLSSALFAAISITIYPFLYDQGLSIVYAIGIFYLVYMFVVHRNDNTMYLSLIIVFISLFPLHKISPEFYLVKLILLLGVFFFFSKIKIKEQYLQIIVALLAILFLFYGNVFGLIFSKVTGYLATGTLEEGLRFYSVKQTVREAGSIPFSTYANRTSGSVLGVLIALVGYIILVIRRREFIIALPLIGIGIFALWGGLRFTVYAVPVAAMSAVYLFFVLAEYIKDNKVKYTFIASATALMIYPNITHIISYKVPTVLNKSEVQDLVKLNEIADAKDYTLTWWDYGYPIWFYSDTSTLIDGGKHNNDNYIISKIMQTSSQQFAANLSRLAVETYVDSNYSIVANELFKKKKQKVLLDELKKSDFKLPTKTRDIYLYLPFRMMRIFPTVAVFGNINLETGRKERNMHFYPSAVASQQGGKVVLQNGIVYDSMKGTLRIGDKTKSVYRFDVAMYKPNGKSQVQSKLHSIAGEFCVVYLQSYGQMVVMDRKTYESAYVQMFMLEKYDKNLFELVVSSPYSKIFKLRK